MPSKTLRPSHNSSSAPSSRWVDGTFSESRVESFSGAGGEHTHQSQFRFAADHPAVPVQDRGMTPVEFLLHGLAAYITAGIGNIAAARGVTLSSVESRVEGDIDLRGILGISHEVRNGYQNIRVSFDIAGDAPAEKLRDIVEQSRARSAVFDVLGMQFQRRRNSSFIDGVGHDAWVVAQAIAEVASGVRVA